MVINTNLPMMNALDQQLRIAGPRGGIARAMERLSTGLRINRGEDDPSGLGISESTRAQVRGINTAMHNAGESEDIYTMRDAYMEEIQQMVQRIRDLAVRSSNEATLTGAQRAEMNDEVQGLMEQINKISLGSHQVGGGARLLFAPTKLDVIWVLDATASMGPAVTALSNASAQMFNEFKQNDFDVRMAVTPFSDDIHQTYSRFLPTPIDYSVSWLFQRDAASFKSDVDVVRDLIIDENVQYPPPMPLYGTFDVLGRENGLLAVNNTVDAAPLGGSFRTDPGINKVIILLTDEDSDDFVVTNSPPVAGGEEPGANPGGGAVRAALINKLATNDITMHVVGQCRYEPTATPDQDYSLIATDPQIGGISLGMTDTDTAWVTTITNTLKSSASPWNGIFQVGPDNGHSLTTTFNSVTTGTMGLTGADVSSASNAQNTITLANDAINWISDERALTGITVRRIGHIINDLNVMSINNSAFKSGISDADMAEEVVNLTISQMLNNTVQSAQVQANSNVKTAAQYLDVVSNSENIEQFGDIFTVQAM